MSDLVSAPAPSPSTDKRETFRKRSVSTICLWTAVIVTLAIGWAPGVLLFLALISLAGLYEFYRMLECGGLACDRKAGMTLGVIFFAAGMPLLAKFGPVYSYEFELGFLSCALLAIGIRQLAVAEAPHPGSVASIAHTFLGLLYVAWLMNFLAKIFYLAPQPPVAGGPSGVFYVFYLLVVTKFSDMGAYLLGSAIGKHKMIPRISPGKTWEGFAGALLASVIASVVLVACWPAALKPITLLHSIGLGLVLSLAAVLGDLMESLIKRGACIKDSGALLPGIGGVLDLLDSVLFTAPLFYIYLRFTIA
ncbi:MAG: CDP-archaeol synthase [Verrucomicrobia bacterium]|nr:CDP-archaeol synthase [Verrucomicrobiota bacterium]